MKFGVDIPNLGDYADPRTVAELAREAEDVGWDGFFIWDHILMERTGGTPVGDPWTLLAVVAAGTMRLRLGPMITPLARRRPWVVARQSVTLDHLSGGRLILGVGLGYPPDVEFETFGEEADDRARAKKLDEGLDVLAGLWSGEPFSYSGEHYTVRETAFQPASVQEPRIPVWVAAMSESPGPLRRAARWDGAFPIKAGPSGPEMLTPDDVREVLSYLGQHREEEAPFDFVVAGVTPGDDPARASDIIAPLAEAGVTWWMEAINPWVGPLEAMRQRVRQGPPRLDA